MSSLEIGHTPTLLRSSISRVWKNKRSDEEGRQQKVTSGGAEGRSVDVSTAGASPLALAMDRGTQSTHTHTHTHTLSSTEREDRSLCVWL